MITHLYNYYTQMPMGMQYILLNFQRNLYVTFKQSVTYKFPLVNIQF